MFGRQRPKKQKDSALINAAENAPLIAPQQQEEQPFIMPVIQIPAPQAPAPPMNIAADPMTNVPPAPVSGGQGVGIAPPLPPPAPAMNIAYNPELAARGGEIARPIAPVAPTSPIMPAMQTNPVLPAPLTGAEKRGLATKLFEMKKSSITIKASADS